MTRKQAVLKAIEKLQTNKKNDEIVSVLKEIYDDLPLTHWTRKSLSDAFQQYINDNGSFPGVRDLGNELPVASVIQRLYGLSFKDFRDTYFPGEYKIKYRYDRYSDEDIKKCFIKNYNQINHGGYVKYAQYDLYREKDTPSVSYIIKRCKCNTYSELLHKLGIKKRTKIFTVNSNKKIVNTSEELISKTTKRKT